MIRRSGRERSPSVWGSGGSAGRPNGRACRDYDRNRCLVNPPLHALWSEPSGNAPPAMGRVRWHANYLRTCRRHRAAESAFPIADLRQWPTLSNLVATQQTLGKSVMARRRAPPVPRGVAPRPPHRSSRPNLCSSRYWQPRREGNNVTAPKPMDAHFSLAIRGYRTSGAGSGDLPDSHRGTRTPWVLP